MTNTPTPPDDLDVHTEHCCARHGCKYGYDIYETDKECSVATGKKKQSFPCEACEDDPPPPDDLEAERCPFCGVNVPDSTKYVSCPHCHGSFSFNKPRSAKCEADDDLEAEVLSLFPCATCGNEGRVPMGEHFVTRDMAIDAGDRSMEGMSMGIEYAECRDCPHDIREAVLTTLRKQRDVIDEKDQAYAGAIRVSNERRQRIADLERENAELRVKLGERR